MKVGLALALARYFHGVSAEDVRRIPYLIIPLILIALPSALVLKQPDLGTALFLIMTGGAVFFVAGVPKDFAAFAGQARTQVGEALELVDQDRFEFC